MVMNDKQREALFFQLYNAKNEAEVESIISKDAILNDNKNWQPYGGNQNNFGTFENQQNHPVPALVEKITNSIDACLIKKCEEKDIDPKSSEAPQSMYQAVEKLYGIKNCNINDLTNDERRAIAQDIQVIATGDKGQPNIRIYDNGEGQLPEDFEKTLLSLHKGNKNQIPFVQGKYNMGSTGAVVFCGDKKYQLIGSKRANDSSARFGFTLVRKHPLTQAEKNENYRSTWYEYLTIEGMIPSFDIDKLDLQLKNKVFETGTIIQMYSYQLPHGAKGDISTDLYRSFNQYFYNLPLPFLVYEARSNYDYESNIGSKVIKGNRNRIDDDRHNNVDKTISLELQTNLGTGNEYFKIPVDITVFKEKCDHREFIANKNFIFTLNGQLHAFEGQTFISTDLGFPLLKKSTLVAVNCNYLPVDIMQELFMSNRTHLKQGNLTEKLRKEVISVIKEDGTLKKINQQRKESLIGKSNNDDFNDVIGMLPKNSEIFDFLKKDSHLPFSKVTNKKNSGSDKKSNKPRSTQLQRFPSHFKINLKENDEGRRLKAVPLNQSGHVDIKTDVEDDYLFRSSDAGELNIDILQKRRVGDEKATSNGGVESDVAQSIKVNRSGPSDGNIRLNINPTEDAKVGDEIEVRVSLTSPSETFTCQFHVRIDEKIVPPKDKSEKPSNQYPDPPAARKAYETPKNNTDLAWGNEQLSWDGSDIVKIISGGDESKLLVEAIVVNMDSYVLKEFINKNKYKEEKDIQRISTKYFQLIYTHSLGLYSICTKMQNKTTDSENKDEVFDIQQVDDFISRLIKSYSSFLLYMDLHNEDIMKKMTDED